MTPGHEGRLRVDATQLAWLTELGIDRKLLATMADTVSLFADAVPARDPVTVATQTAVVSRGAPLPPGQTGPAEPIREALSVRPVEPVQPLPLTASVETVQLKPGPLPSDLASLASTVAQCQKCGLGSIRHQAVFGDGSVESPDWMVIGEVPGDHDDHTGLPFQGQAGELLNLMLVSAGILPASRLFYANLLKCRPKGARSPKAVEIEACLPYLKQQIALIRPSGLLVLGWQAAQALVNQRASLDQLRGQVHRYQNDGLDIPLIVTHHPATLMLRGHLKNAAWQDLHLARRVLKTG